MLRLPKVYDVSFRNPRQKPQGLVAPDSTASSANGLVNVIGDSISRLTNLGDGEVGHGRHGSTVRNSLTSSADGWRADGASSVSTYDRFSVFIVFEQTSFPASGNGHVLYAERPNSDQIFKIVHDDGELGWVIRNNSGSGLQERPILVPMDTGKVLHTAAFVKTNLSKRELYVDDNYGVYTGFSGDDYINTDVILSCDTFDAASANPYSKILAAYTFRRPLSAADYSALSQDPFSLLSPVEASLYMSGVAPTPPIGATIPVFNKHYRNQGMM